MKNKKYMHFTVNFWHITGYAGWDDYDGPSDDNVDEVIVISSIFTKDDVISLFKRKYNGSRCTSFRAEQIGTSDYNQTEFINEFQ